MARNAKKDLWDASTHSFLMAVRPRQRTEVQIPETAQPRQGVGSPSCVLFMLIRSRHAGRAAPLLRREHKCLSLGLGAWCSTQITHSLLFLSPFTGCLRPETHEPIMHPNPASPPTSPAMGSKFHYISQEGFSFFLREHLASETS